MATVLTWVNVVVLLGVSGLFALYSLIPFAMANDDPRSGPLVKYGLLQLAALGGVAMSALLGGWVASRARNHDGWAAVGVGAAGWGVWIGCVVLTIVSFSGIAALDMAVATWWRRRLVNRRLTR
jgi:hypothetical protein